MKRWHWWGAGLFYLAAWLLTLALYVHAEYRVSLYPTQDAVPWQLEAWRGATENIQSELFQGGVTLLVPALFMFEVIRRRSKEGQQQDQLDMIEQTVSRVEIALKRRLEERT